MQLDKLYAVDISEFDFRLKQKSEGKLCASDLALIIELEVELLQENYSRIVKDRDKSNFDVNFAVTLQKAIEAKRDKLARYKNYINKKGL